MLRRAWTDWTPAEPSRAHRSARWSQRSPARCWAISHRGPSTELRSIAQGRAYGRSCSGQAKGPIRWGWSFERRALGGFSIASTPEPLAAWTAAITRSTLGSPWAGAWTGRSVPRASRVVLVSGDDVRPLTATAVISTTFGTHLDDNRRAFVLNRAIGRGDAKLLQIREFLKQRFFQTLGHALSQCTRRAQPEAAPALNSPIIVVAAISTVRGLCSSSMPN